MAGLGLARLADAVVGPARRLFHWAQARGLGRKMALGLTGAALTSAVVTYGAISGVIPFGQDPELVVWLLNLNLALVLSLGFVVAHRLVQVWAERRRGLAGSRLHIRFVTLFGAIAVAPAITVAVFSGLFLNVGVQGWFNERVRSALNSSKAVAEAYLQEHTQAIRADALAMAADLNRDAISMLSNRQLLEDALAAQSAFRALSEAMVLDGIGRPLARAGLTFSLEFDWPPPQWAMDAADAGDVAVMTSDQDDRVRALVRLDQFIGGGGYLFVGRLVDARVVAYVEQTQRAVDAYQQMEGRRSGLQITFAMVFVILALLLLLAAVWVGLAAATKLARPIAGLVAAAERIRAGDLTARAADAPAKDELGSLSRAFNRMASQLEAQRAELVEANQQLDLRRRFTETVLEGVSAGVIGLDAAGRMRIVNKRAAELLGPELERRVGESFADIAPDLSELVDQTARRPDRRADAQIKLTVDGRARTLHVRAAAETSGEQVVGYVVTCDDVSDLLAAQRMAAWGDVARRIAHEIKNPLTPIQLSAERLKRRFLKEISSDPDTFSQCADTIIRQVGDIGRMVDEFSSFARMPAPVMRAENLAMLARETAVLFRNGAPSVDLTLETPEQAPPTRCDGRQLRQAMINLLQNAVDAIDGRDDPDAPRGKVIMRLRFDDKMAFIEVEDNGKGLPSADRERLTEPYVTTRAKGTGLGLAIVKKIMEDHAGDVLLEDAPTGGARATLMLPLGAPDIPADGGANGGTGEI